MADTKTVVIDPGAAIFKFGFSGHETPEVYVPSVVGSVKKRRDVAAAAAAAAASVEPESSLGVDENGGSSASGAGYLCGDEALALRDLSSLRWPIEDGIVRHWDDFERLCQHAYALADIDSEYHPVVLTDSVLNSRTNRESLCSSMFEAFGVPAFYVAMQPVLSLYASGRTSGLVLDSGHSHSYAVPVIDGVPNTIAVYESGVTGAAITTLLRERLGPLIEPFCMNRQELELVIEDIKHRRLFVHEDRPQERDPSSIISTMPSATATTTPSSSMPIQQPLSSSASSLPLSPATTAALSSSSQDEAPSLSAPAASTTTSTDDDDSDVTSMTLESTSTTSQAESTIAPLPSNASNDVTLSDSTIGSSIAAEQHLQSLQNSTTYNPSSLSTSSSSSTPSGTATAPLKYTLKNGKTISLPVSELLACGEAYFYPNAASSRLETLPLHWSAYHAITDCRQEHRRLLYDNVILAGGNTLVRGVPQRMRKELSALTPGSNPIQLVAPDDRHVSAWLGGGIVASLPFFPQTWISKEEYDEVRNRNRKHPSYKLILLY